MCFQSGTPSNVHTKASHLPSREAKPGTKVEYVLASSDDVTSSFSAQEQKHLSTEPQPAKPQTGGRTFVGLEHVEDAGGTVKHGLNDILYNRSTRWGETWSSLSQWKTDSLWWLLYGMPFVCRS